MKKLLSSSSIRNLSLLIIIFLISAISCTKPKFNPEKIFKEHNRAELDYFIDVGFKRLGSIQKQTENIEISIIGTPQKSDIELINTIIEELKPLIIPLNIKRVEKGGNLSIYFTPSYNGTTPKEASGQTFDLLRVICGTNLFKTSIWISPELSGIEKGKVFRHEFCHALGFMHPTLVNNEYSKSVMQTKGYYFFNDSTKEIEGKNTNFSEMDKAAIRILYDKNIPNGLSKKSFINLYEKFKKDDFYQQNKQQKITGNY